MSNEILEIARHVITGLNDISCCDCKHYDLNFGACNEDRECDEIIVDAASVLNCIIDHYKKYRWHDLRKDPNDLPVKGFREYVPCLVTIEGTSVPQYAEWEYFEGYGFGFVGFGFNTVIAWREIELFESEEE